MERRGFKKGLRTLKNRGISHKVAVKIMRYYAIKNNNQWIKLTPKASVYLILMIIYSILGNHTESAIVTNLFKGALVGMITSEAVESFVEKYGSQKLKKISYTFEIWRFKFSGSVFVLVTLLVEILLFS